MYVYIIKSIKYNWHYVGLTEDIERRFAEHYNGLVSKTKFYRPFRLIHVELTTSLEKARVLEKFFKSGYGREIIKEIEENFEIIIK